MGEIIIKRGYDYFENRKEAGQYLAKELAHLKYTNVVVLGIPRGGIIIADEISKHLDAELDVIISHKIGAPFNPELAIGAVSESGEIYLDDRIISQINYYDKFLHKSSDYVKAEAQKQLLLIKEKITAYRRILPKSDIKGRIVIITDDGLATGSTMVASLWTAKKERPKELVVALPVGPSDTVKRLAEMCDRVVCLIAPDTFNAVGEFYRDFGQTQDEEVINVLHAAKDRREHG